MPLRHCPTAAFLRESKQPRCLVGRGDVVDVIDKSMAGGIRSEQARLSRAMRDAGCSWRQAADEFAARWSLTYLQAFRLAHGLSQRQAAERYNSEWHPARPLTGQHIFYWEVWPSASGNRSPAISGRDDAINLLAGGCR